MDSNITTERESRLGILARTSQEKLFRGRDFLFHQATRLASLSQTLVREHPDFKKRALLLAAGVGIVGIVGAVVVRDYIVGREISNTVQTSQSTSVFEQSTVVPDDDRLPPPFKDAAEIDRYMRDYLENDIGDGIRDREWVIVAAPKLIKIKVTDSDGITNVCDFPTICNNPGTQKRVSRRIPTRGSGTGPTYKTLPYDTENYIEGVFTNFVYEIDPESRFLLNIWAVRFSDEGGWPSLHAQPHPEFLRVCGFEQGSLKCYVILEDEDGVVPVEDLFRGSLFVPRNIRFPKPEVASISPIRLSYSRYLKEFQGLESRKVISAAA